MSINFLLIDDDYAADLAAPQQLQAALRAVDSEIQLHCAADYPAAAAILASTPIDVILIDACFGAAASTLLDDQLEVVTTPDPRLQAEQGLLIVRRIAHELGYLRPAGLLFIDQDEVVRAAEALREDGLLDLIQHKPVHYQSGEPLFDQLVSFLRWRVHPLNALRRAGIIVEKPFARFFSWKKSDWRRATTPILSILADLAEQHNHNLLDMRIYRLAKEQQLLPDLDTSWEKPALWAQLLAPLGRFEPWHPWCSQLPARPRVRFFKYHTDTATSSGLPPEDPEADAATAAAPIRLLMLIDPRFLPEYSQQERLEIERHFQPLAQTPPGQPGRLELPAQAPGGQTPWLLGTWFDLPTASDTYWLPLDHYRRSCLTAAAPLRAAVREFAQAVARSEPAALQTPTHRYGLLLDGILVERHGQHSLNHHPTWLAPLLPLHKLHLPADPEVDEPLAYSYLQQLQTLEQWLQAVTYWFAWGRLPALPAGTSIDRVWQSLQALLQGEVTPITIQRWWQESEPPATSDADRVERIEKRLYFTRSTRCLDAPGSRPLTVPAALTLSACTCRCETDANGDAITLFEQLAFTQPVSLFQCRIRRTDGHLDVLRLHDCDFHRGLDLSGIEAAGIELFRCRFFQEKPGQPALRIGNTVLSGDLSIDGCEIHGEFAITQTTVQELTCQVAGGALLLGPNLRTLARTHLDLHRGTVALLAHTEMQDRLDIVLDDTASLAAHHCRLHQDVHAALAQATRPLSLTRCQIGGHLRLDGPLPAAPVQEAQSHQFLVAIEESRLERDLLANGLFALHLRHTTLLQNLRVSQYLVALLMDDTQVLGSLDLTDIRLYGNAAITRCQINRQLRAERGRFQRLNLHSTLCQGDGLFAGSVFNAPVRFVDESEHHDDSPALCGTVFRNQIDFSQVTFQRGADFSQLVSERLIKFDAAKFQAEARFRAIQAGGNVSFYRTSFHAAADFRRSLVAGVFDLQQAIFHYPPAFDGATFRGTVRLRDVQWPIGQPADPAVSFQKAILDSLLDLSNPRDTDGYAILDQADSQFLVDLKDASVAELILDPAFMQQVLDAEETILEQLPKSHKPAFRRQLLGVSQIFENTERKRMRFRAADHFYRRSNRYVPSFTSTLMRWLWGYGTRPGRVLLWMLGVTGGIAGSSLWVSLQTGISSNQLIQRVVQTFVEVILAQSPTYWSSLPLWYAITATGLLLAQTILLHLFFAALARKLLRW